MDKINITDLGEIFDALKELTEDQKAEEAKRQRIERFTGFFSRVNSAFTFRPVTVTVESSPIKAPAWSGASDVHFNANEIGELDTAESIASIKGLDLHEVSHILYTSREGSDLVSAVIDKKMWTAFNALEDQRIESFFTAKYPSTVAWFSAMILTHFKNNPEVFENSYPLLCGRRYLPVEIRRESRALYPHQDKVDEFKEIINEYRTLVFPTDTDRGLELIEQYYNLLPKSEGGNGEETGTPKYKAVNGEGEGGRPVRVIDPCGHGSRPNEGIESSPASRPVPPRQQEKERDRAGGNPEDLDDDLPEIKAEDIDWSDFNDQGDQSDEASNSDGGEADDSEVTSPEQSLNAGANAGEMISTVLNEILSESGIAQEINDILRVISGQPLLTSNNSQEPERARYSEIMPDSVTVEASRSFGRELERLRASFDPAWDRYENAGRLSVGRYMRGDDFDTIFDQWNEGREDATDIECVIAIDHSGSMQGSKIANANRAMYAIKRALDRIDASTTVIAFSDETHLLYRASEKANSQIRDSFSGGGTTPDEAIKYATKVLAESDRKIKIFFIITDGEWYGEQSKNEDAIERMARSGVLTAFAYIPEINEEVVLTAEKAHKCEIGAVVANPFDLITMARAIVKYAISRRLTNA
jgi:uncharacterized protein YegL